MGLEPTPSGVTGRRYNQLNYDPVFFNSDFRRLRKPRPSRFILTVTACGFRYFQYGRRNRTRTCDIHGVSVALSHLSYPPLAVASSKIDKLSTLSMLVKEKEIINLHRQRRVSWSENPPPAPPPPPFPSGHHPRQRPPPERHPCAPQRRSSWP